MKIKWLGWSSFLITSNKGTRVITDPYHTDELIPNAEINESADIVTCSHGHHWSHCYVVSISGEPQVYKGLAPVAIKDIKLRSVLTDHDEHGGQYFGKNTIICIEVDDVRICHLGDLGQKLSAQHLAQIGRVDILLIPVMGVPVMSLKMCNLVSSQLQPKIIIPMHYHKKIPYDDLPPSPAGIEENIFRVEEFLKDKKNVKDLSISEMEFKAGKFPSGTQIIVLEPAY